MKDKFTLSLFTRVFLSTLSISALITVILAFASYTKIEKIHLEGKREALSQSVENLRTLIDSSGLCPLAYTSAKNDYNKSNIRTTIIDSDGVVIYDSNANPKEMLNHANRPEVKKALLGKENFTQRFSETTREGFLYIASFAGDFSNGSYQYCIRQAIPILNITKDVKMLALEIFAFCVFIVILAAIASALLARKLAMPLKKLSILALSYEAGNFDNKAPNFYIPEINNLSRSMQSMAGELKLRISSLAKRNSELDEIFEQMTQIVFICNCDGRILRLNKAGKEILNIKEDVTKERVYIREVLRSTKLIEAIENTFKQRNRIREEIEIQDRDYILLSKILPYDSPKSRILCVLNDISHISANEKLRREFVSSVSHELKTPITAIQMAVETIQECSTKEESENFLSMINKETFRMNTLVDDMLLLSKIEYAESMQMKEFQEENLKSLLEVAISSNENIAQSRNVDVKLECPSSIKIKCDQTLIRLAFSNLINNAIKYGKENSTLNIEAFELKNSVELSFRDSSSGISKEDLERIFERFYRVNKGRARNLGGTGLGLAIVKHIIKLHSANIEVSSKLGVGSKFTITFNK